MINFRALSNLKKSKTLALWRNNMSVEGRIDSLIRKHRELHERIEVLEAEHAPDKYIIPLKKEKLLLKDQIQKLQNDKVA